MESYYRKRDASWFKNLGFSTQAEGQYVISDEIFENVELDLLNIKLDRDTTKWIKKVKKEKFDEVEKLKSEFYKEKNSKVKNMKPKIPQPESDSEDDPLLEDDSEDEEPAIIKDLYNLDDFFGDFFCVEGEEEFEATKKNLKECWENCKDEKIRDEFDKKIARIKILLKQYKKLKET